MSIVVKVSEILKKSFLKKKKKKDVLLLLLKIRSPLSSLGLIPVDLPASREPPELLVVLQT